MPTANIYFDSECRLIGPFDSSSIPIFWRFIMSVIEKKIRFYPTDISKSFPSTTLNLKFMKKPYFEMFFKLKASVYF